MIRRSVAASLVAAIGVAGAALTSESVRAEGRCPPGQYPIGGRGVGGCAPIPASQGEGSSGPRAIGKWIKTWGAISRSVATGDVGASVGKRSKAEAVAEAQSRCATYGAKDCTVGITYKNQCVAYADPAPGSKGLISMAGGPTREAASTEVLKYCAAHGGGQCTIKYTDCSEPIFQEF
ncbi:DUF4189 domain-containing protein [Stenotrophomonas muris]|uniref:DUF4189 domain-containing protein n=1 Tax=Stenotrophomonas muris TaxID=2963283 RepID=UPI002E7A0D4B|nr:DUF4189 domain-containing protein [Stenotrophomonas muris]